MPIPLKQLKGKMHVSYHDPSKKVLMEPEKDTKLDEAAKINVGLGHVDPPTLLILRRKAIRVFPDGKKVALYYSDKLGKYVSVPYGEKNGDIPVFAEENLQEAVIHRIKAVSSGSHKGPVRFSDGSSMMVDKDTADCILAVHSQLNDENVERFEDKMGKDRLNFAAVAGFCKGLHTSLGQKMKNPKKKEEAKKPAKKKGSKK